MNPNLAPDTPRVTAVVLNWCDEAATDICLRSLQAASYPALSILLVDNGSEDGSGERLHEQFPDVGYLQTGANLGFSAGNNRGIDRALAEGAEYVFILNNDAWAEADALTSLIATATSRKGIGAVAPTIMRMDDPDRTWYGGGSFDVKRGLGVHWNGVGPKVDHPRPVTFFTGCAVLFQREMLEEVGAFDESYFMYVEDAELSLRMLRSGWEIMHDPGARVHHRVPPEGSEDGTRQIFFRDRNRRRLARAHFGLPDRLRFGLWFYPTRAAHLVRYLAKGDFSRAGAIVRGAISH